MEMKFQFCDVFGLDPDLLGMVPQPCIALLLLFPINDKVKLSSTDDSSQPMQQMLSVYLLFSFFPFSCSSKHLKRRKMLGLKKMGRLSLPPCSI